MNPNVDGFAILRERKENNREYAEWCLSVMEELEREDQLEKERARRRLVRGKRQMTYRKGDIGSGRDGL